MSLTNYERWLAYMRDVGSPQSFIDFGFYYLISAALQRRVWIGDESSGVFANTYISLVGGPGVGKGQVIGPVSDLLKSIKVVKKNVSTTDGDVNEIEDDNTPEIKEAVVDTSQFSGKKDITKIKPEPYLIAIGGDTTTFEALMREHSKATKCVLQKIICPKTGKTLAKTLVYASICFIVEEIAYIIRKNEEKTMRYLLTAYDCKDYDYITKNQGADLIRKPSLSILAGTNPKFMENALNAAILDEGLASRFWFIYETTPRFVKYDKTRFDRPDQIIIKKELQDHIRHLTTLYGECKLSEEADAYLKNWWENEHQTKRANNSTKLEYYYARKKVHVWKLCMCIHFSESFEMTIGVDVAKKALQMFEVIEKNMHYAVSFDNKNPLYALGKKIIAQLKRCGPMSRVELLMEFGNEARDSELTESLSTLIMCNKVEAIGNGVYGIPKKEI